MSVWQEPDRVGLVVVRYIAKGEYRVVPTGWHAKNETTPLEVYAPVARGRAATAMEQDRYRAWLAPLCTLQQDVGIVPNYVPATADQLRLTEARLSFALPAALQAFYTLVANGGD